MRSLYEDLLSETYQLKYNPKLLYCQNMVQQLYYIGGIIEWICTY